MYCDVGQGESGKRDPFALKSPGAIYHLTSRGSARQKVFSDARSTDRELLKPFKRCPPFKPSTCLVTLTRGRKSGVSNVVNAFCHHR